MIVDSVDKKLIYCSTSDVNVNISFVDYM